LTADPVADQAGAVLGVLDRALPPGVLLGAYLYGSAIVGGLKPDSDLDVLAVVERRLADGERDAVLASLLPISGRQTRPAGWRPVELTVVVAGEVRPWRYPPRMELQYGEWLRAEALAGRLVAPPSSPDVAILLTMVRAASRPLVGPPAEVLLDPVPAGDMAHAIHDEVGPLLAELETDTRNVLLTLARMWSTLATGEVRSKDAAAAWAEEFLAANQARLIAAARAGYLGDDDGPWEPIMPAVRDVADAMTARIRALPPPDASG
jgi:predicted nucleotidyltransferase